MTTQIEMALAAQNIVLTGGNVKFPNFEERFLSEIRPLIPEMCPVNVRRHQPPANFDVISIVNKEFTNYSLLSGLYSR